MGDGRGFRGWGSRWGLKYGEGVDWDAHENGVRSENGGERN